MLLIWQLRGYAWKAVAIIQCLLTQITIPSFVGTRSSHTECMVVIEDGKQQTHM